MSKRTLLGQYLLKNHESERAFSARVGCSSSVVHRWAWGDRIPEARFAFQIEVVTKGEVPVSYWAGLGNRRARRAAVLAAATSA